MVIKILSFNWGAYGTWGTVSYHVQFLSNNLLLVKISTLGRVDCWLQQTTPKCQCVYTVKFYFSYILAQYRQPGTLCSTQSFRDPGFFCLNFTKYLAVSFTRCSAIGHSSRKEKEDNMYYIETIGGPGIEILYNTLLIKLWRILGNVIKLLWPEKERKWFSHHSDCTTSFYLHTFTIPKYKDIFLPNNVSVVFNAWCRQWENWIHDTI